MQGSPVKTNPAPQQGGYPPPQQGSPVKTNPAPQQGGYPPPQQGAYPPQQGGYPPQQGGYPPQQGGYPPQQGGYHQQTPYPQAAKAPSGFDRLVNREAIYIKQKIDIAEVSSGCERANSYFVYGTNRANEKTGVELFRARETSDFCVRQLLSGHCRPFTLNVLLRDVDEKVHNQAFLELKRPCACTFYCIGRPVVTVTLVEGGKSTFIGKIVDPFEFLNCDAKLDVYNASNTVAYKIRGNCCQRGLLCNLPCESCQTADFKVNSTHGQQVATLQKRTAGFFASAYTEADNFALTFPVNATPEDKALLMAATLFLDYRYFEEKKGIV